MERVLFVEPLNGYRVRLGFTDGSVREVDLARYLHGPVFDAIRSDPQVFRSVKVDKRMGTYDRSGWKSLEDFEAELSQKELRGT